MTNTAIQPPGLDVLAWASALGGDATTAGRLHAVTERERNARGWAWGVHERAWHDAAERRRRTRRPSRRARRRRVR